MAATLTPQTTLGTNTSVQFHAPAQTYPQLAAHFLETVNKAHDSMDGVKASKIAFNATDKGGTQATLANVQRASQLTLA